MRAAAHAALLEGGVAEAVIGGALVAVLQDVIGLVDFLEAVLAFLVAGIAVGMMLHGELAERGLQLGVARGARDAQDFVIVALGHAGPALDSRRRHSRDLIPAIRSRLRQRCTPGVEPGGDDFRRMRGHAHGSAPCVRPISCCSCRRRPR